MEVKSNSIGCTLHVTMKVKRKDRIGEYVELLPKLCKKTLEEDGAIYYGFTQKEVVCHWNQTLCSRDVNSTSYAVCRKVKSIRPQIVQ